VALETGTSAFFVARQLSALGLRPVVVDAHEVRLKAHRPPQKSDRRAARELGEGLRRGIYRCLVHVPPLPVAQFRETLARRRHFVRVQSAEIHAAKRLRRAAGLGRLSRNLRTEVGWTTLLQGLTGYGEVQTDLQQHHAVWRCAREQTVALEQLRTAPQPPVTAERERWQALPGVGPIVALTVLAVLSEVRRFPSAKHAASYAGLLPSTAPSGARDRHGYITKRGSGELRAMLCEAAQHARRPDPPLNPYFTHLWAQRGYRMAVGAVAHRLCRIMVAMLRDPAAFTVRKLPIEEGPFERTPRRRYRRKAA
jgi:transposase